MTPQISDTFYFDSFHFRANERLLYRGGAIVALEPRAASVLLYLIENRERLVSKEELLETVWSDVFTTDDVLKKAVSQIRRALSDDAENPRFVQTLHRRGYRFIADVSDTANDSSNAATRQIAAEKFDAIDPNFDQLIGRASEMDFLRAEFRRAAVGKGQPVLIAGEPGIGKTQLTKRFQQWATEQNAVCVRARFFDYEAASVSAFDLFLGLLEEALKKSGGGEEIGSAQIDLRREIQNQLGVVLPDELFAVASNERYQAKTDAFQMIVPLAASFLELSRKRPLVVLLDDLQWADDTSLKIIGYLMRAADDAPLMLVALSRRAEIETPAHKIAEWLRAQAVYRSYTTLKLSALSETDYRALISEIFARKLDETRIPPDDLRKLHRTTGGNPYFLAETVRTLINEGVVERDGANGSFAWHWRGLRDVPLPETVRMAARAKIEMLSEKARNLVECAAVLGDAFQIETLERMSDRSRLSEEEFEACLDEAVAIQVLTERDVSGADDCQFYHTTLRRAVYSDLSPRRRKRLHARAAHAIKAVHAETVERLMHILGAHYDAAGDAKASFDANLRACEAAVARFDWTEAAECLARAERAAKSLTGASDSFSDESYLRFLLAKGETFLSTGKRAEAETVLEEAARIAGKTNNRATLAAARGIQAHARVLLGNYRESLAAAEEALKLSRETENRQGVANALLQIASSRYSLGDFEAACEGLQKVVDDYGAESYYTAVALGKLGWVYALQGRYKEAKNFLRKALEFHKNAGDVRQRVVLALCLDWAEYGAGNYEAAICFAAKARDEARNLGESYSEAVALMRIGKARAAQGLYAESENFLKASTEKLKDLNSRHAEAETVWMLGRVRAASEKFVEAETLFNQSLEIVREVGDREDEFRILIDIAHLENERENPQAALEVAERAAQIAEEIKVPDGVGSAFIEKSESLLRLGKIKESRRAAVRAAEILEEFASGERWKAYFALARSLRAGKKSQICEIKTSKIKIETAADAARRSLELLENIRAQFKEEDAERRRQFALAHQKPARLLREIIASENRFSEAEEISRVWLLEEKLTTDAHR